jgi:hypothetical protein
MPVHVNPFAELYVGETVPPTDFVRLFSPFLVEHALLLFQRGNVVLTGTQGSGKTMLLSLLRPSIRMAFKAASEDFPVPGRLSRFISAGISLRNSGVMAFGQRALHKDPSVAQEVTPLYFGDYLNYSLVYDLLLSLQHLARGGDPEIAASIGLSTADDAHDRFATLLAKDPCWLGALQDVRTFEELKAKLLERIDAYMAFFQFNSPTLPIGIANSKTTPGIPMSRAARALSVAGVADEDVNVFIRIDQYEELDGIRRLPTSLGAGFREVINKVLGMRDPHVFYRVGARRHAWGANLRMYGSGRQLEHQREYEEIDLEEILRRKENRRTYLFLKFAADVTRRRLVYAGYRCALDGEKLLRTLFPPIRPEDKAHRYLSATEGLLQLRALAIDPQWPESWRKHVLLTAQSDPLAARLESAWIMQHQARSSLPSEPPRIKPAMGWTREYWRKERVPQALMQLAAAAGQRMIWTGYRDIEALAGGNILVYASIAKHVWAAWLRTAEQPFHDAGTPEVPSFSYVAQTAGIEEASLDWFRKVAEQPGGGIRQKFISVVGRLFVKALLDDKAMSYPGHNGFSIAEDELHNDPKLCDWLNEASDIGDLVEVVHTTKERDRRPRRKYYFQPILSPYLRLPAVHVKEPLYVSASVVRDWFSEAEGNARFSVPRIEAVLQGSNQLPLI